MPDRTSAGRTRVERSWVEHLRAGGSTPWPEWVRRSADAPPGSRPPAADAPMPGAAQLELLRRLNLQGPGDPERGRWARADHVLGRAGPGRGSPDLPLPWPPAEPSPAPEGEVLRVAGGVLADLAAQLPPVPAAWPSRRRRTRGAPSFLLEGAPVTVARLRSQLAAAELFEHSPVRPWFRGPVREDPDVVLVVAEPLVEALRQAWSRRVQEGSVRSWSRYVSVWHARAGLPPSASLLVTVDRWVRRVGAGRVHVVTGEGLADQVAEVLGRAPVAGSGQAGHRPGDPRPLGPLLVDVLRRVNAVLPFVVGGDDLPDRRTALAQIMQELRLGPPTLALPDGRRAWVERSAALLEEGLRSRGCVVHGDLGVLHAGVSDTARRLRAGDLASATVRMILRVEERLGTAVPGAGGEGRR